MAAPYTGAESTVTFGTSGWTGNIVSGTFPTVTRTDRDTSHLGTTGYKTYSPGDLKEGDAVSIVVQYDPPHAPPLAADPETITIYLKAPNKSISFQGYCNSFGGFTFGQDENMEATMGIKVADDITGL